MPMLENIRIDFSCDDSELRESLRTYGWHPELPAIIDEFDVVLVGHRRLKLAEELKITPIVKVLTFGTGETGDAERLRLALVSNIGGQPLTKKDRQHLAEYLYGRGWTMERIGEALDVNQATVSRDLNYADCINQDHPKTETNPKGSGRPKGKRSKRETSPKPHAKAPEIVEAHDEGKTYREVAEEVGVSPRTVRHVVEQERIYREGQTDPIIDPATLTEKDKFAAAIRQARREIEQQVRAEEKARIHKWLEETRLPMFEKKWEEMIYLLETKKGFISKAEYHKVIKCLHTDTRQYVSNAEVNEAFDIFKKLEVVLVREAKPTDSAFADQVAVTSWTQVEEMKRKVREERKAFVKKAN